MMYRKWHSRRVYPRVVEVCLKNRMRLRTVSIPVSFVDVGCGLGNQEVNYEENFAVGLLLPEY